MLRLFVALFVGVYVARYLGPEQFGLLSYASSFVGLFSALATLGLNNIVVRELVKKPERRDELLGTAFWLKIGGAGLMWISIATAIPFTQNDTYENTLIAIIAFSAIFQAFNVINFHYQAQVQSKYVVYANFAQLVVSSIAKLSFVAIKAPLIWFAGVYLLDAVVLAIGLITIYLHKTGKVWFLQWKWSVASALLRDSWPLILSGMLVSIYMKIDQVMIKEMLGTKEVGLYAAAVKLSEAWYFLPVLITNSLFPAIIKAKEVSEEFYYNRLQKLYDLMVGMAIAIALPMTFLSDWIVNLLYGGEYNEAGNILMVHIWAGVFIFLLVASGKWLIVEKMTKYAFYRNFFGAITNLVLNYFLIKEFGVIGAAWATLLSYMLASYLIDYSLGNMRKSFYMKTLAFFPFRFFVTNRV